MATSKDPKVQSLMDEVDNLDANDDNLEDKLRQIAEAVAAAQGNAGPKLAAAGDAPIDPSDAFACEGCQ